MRERRYLSCPACGAAPVRIFHEQHGVPVHSCLLLDRQDEARAFPTGSVVLGFCERCGFITNTAFDPSLQAYSEQYEETQGFSPRFCAFARELAQRWVDRYDLRGKHLFEIGCGKGEFLTLMCRLGGNRGTGIDPSFVPGRLDHDGVDVAVVQDLYTDRYGPIDADAVICRHTLEHIHPVGAFLRAMRAGIGDRSETVVLFELPDVLRVLEEHAFWDVYYEHCSYFSLGSLARLFRASGFEVVDLALDFDDQYLLVEARPGDPSASGAAWPAEDDLDLLTKAVDGFTEAVAHHVGHWRAEVEAASAAGRRVVVWGSGSKGVAYLTTLGLRDEIAYVVDINPHRQGKFMAGTGHAIVAPEHVLAAPPDVVVVMNPIYLDEIRATLDTFGVAAEAVAV